MTAVTTGLRVPDTLPERVWTLMPTTSFVVTSDSHASLGVFAPVSAVTPRRTIPAMMVGLGTKVLTERSSRTMTARDSGDAPDALFPAEVKAGWAIVDRGRKRQQNREKNRLMNWTLAFLDTGLSEWYQQ